MERLWVSYENERLWFKFNSTQFHEIVAHLKSKKWKYDPEVKAWANSPKLFKEGLIDLNDFGTVEISEVNLKLLEVLSDPPVEVTLKRRVLIESFFEKNPPIGDFQKLDTKKMISYGSLLNANDTGIGKTYEAIQTINHMIYYKDIEKVFVITVPETLYNWKRELLSFSEFFEEEEIKILNKDERNFFDEKANYENVKVFIISYDTFALMSDYYYSKKMKFKVKGRGTDYRTPCIPFKSWSDNVLLICDESHLMKGHTSKRSKVILMHRHFFKNRILMTATPHPNGINELYTQSKMINEDICPGSYDDWIKTVAVLGGRSEYDIAYYKPKEVEKFLKRLEPFIIRRFKRDVLPDLPAIRFKNIYVELSPIERQIYQRLIIEELKKIQEENGNLTIKAVMNRFPFIVMAVNDVTFYKDKLISDSNLASLINSWDFKNTSKVKALQTLVDSILEESKQVIIWGTHPSTLDNLGEIFKKYNPLVVHGQSTPKGEDKNKWRDDQVQKMKNDKTHKILFANPAVLSTGVNMQFINKNIYYDRPYSLTFDLQSQGRTDRYGQKEDIDYFHLIADKTIENIQETQMKRKHDSNKSFLLKDTLPQGEWVKLFNGNKEMLEFLDF